MARISDLPNAQAGTDGDLLPVVQAGQTRKQTRTQLRTALLSAWQGFIRTFLAAADQPTARAAIGAMGVSDNITGSAAKLTNSRTLSATGDGAWSVSFDGSANVTAALTLASTGVSAGTYGSVTVNAKGLVTGATIATPVANGGTGLTTLAAGLTSWFATPTSANLAAVVSDETGSGSLVFATAPTLVTPNLGGANSDFLRRGGGGVVKTASFTLAATESWIVTNGSGTITVTLPTGAANIGRELMLRNVAAQAVVSASANVAPLAGGANGTAILAATAGKWVTLVYDGTQWVIMQGN